MKKIIYSAAFICISAIANAQSIPNGNFENWTSMSYEDPQYYIQTSNTEAFYNCNATSANCVKTTDKYHGTYAAQITSVGSGKSCFGYFINSNPNGNPPWNGGAPYNQKPTGIRGYYKSAIPAGDSANIIVNFSAGGTGLAFYIFKLYGTHSAYTPFSFTFSPALASTPDSVILGVTSSDVFNEIAISGSMIQVDSISFTGVTSQPAQLNGDFELWTPKTVEKATNWYMGNGGGQSNGVAKTTDAYKGNYAVQMTTYLGNTNNHAAAQPSQVSTGYYDNCSSNPCPVYGGFPFSNQVDTLTFWYKYAPANNDSAWVSLQFKNNFSQIMGMGQYLLASSSYQYVEVPFNLGQAPDTVVVQFQSSDWKDTLAASLGSVLKVDEVTFKSQPLNTSVPVFNLENHVTVFPNPSNGEFTVQSSIFNVEQVEVYNAVGSKVISKKINSKQGTLNINDDGIYFIKMTSNGKTFTKKLIVNQ